MGTHDRYWNKGLDKLKEAIHQVKELDKSITNAYNKEPSKSDSGIDIIDNIINNSKKYKNKNEGTRNYIENKKAFEDALTDVIDRYYEKHDIDECDCTCDEDIEEDYNDKDYTEDEMEELYKDFYSSEPEYDNKCNKDCYTCKAEIQNKKPNVKNLFPNKNNDFRLVITDKYLHLNASRKLSWCLQNSYTNKTYIIGSGHIYRYAEQETTIEDVESINEAIVNVLFEKFNTFSLSVIYNNVDVTELVEDSSAYSSYKSKTKMRDLI